VLIFGDKYIPSPDFVRIKTKEDIEKTNPTDILFLEEFAKPFELAKYMQENFLEYGVYVNTLLNGLYANALGASYILASFSMAKELQQIANEYLWDLKVLAIIESEKELEVVAKAFIDGAIYKNSIKEL